MTAIYQAQMQLNTFTPSSACWQGGQQGLLQGTESLLGFSSSNYYPDHLKGLES